MSSATVAPREKRISWRWALLLVVVAWLFAVGLRFYWIGYAKGWFAGVSGPNAAKIAAWRAQAWQWHGHPITNNRDSFLFGCILQKAHLGMHQENNMVPSVMRHGAITALPYLLLQVAPISIDALMVYTSVFVAAFLCIPIVLIGRLYGATFWGFLSALLAGIAYSYYNRTLAAYFDTDMVAVTVPTFALYFLLAATRRRSLAWALAGSLTLFIYPFFYSPGLPVGYGLGLAYIAYQLAFYYRDRLTWSSTALVALGLALAGFSQGAAIAAAPLRWILLLAGLLAAFGLLRQRWMSFRTLVVFALVVLGGFVTSASPVRTIMSRTHQLRQAQQRTGNADDSRSGKRLKFLNALTTVREVAQIPLGQIGIRITGARVGTVLALIGYVLLCYGHPEMLIALPLAGIGAFAYFGGLRFTIFAIPLAALSVVYLLRLLAVDFARGMDRLSNGPPPTIGRSGYTPFLATLLGTVVTGVIAWSGHRYNQPDIARPADLLVVVLAAISIALLYLALTGRLAGAAEKQRRGGPAGRRSRRGKTAAKRRPGPIAAALNRLTRWSFWPGGFATVGTLVLLVPNIRHVIDYKVPVVLARDAVAALDSIRRPGSGTDLVITWWDYGSAVWYYSGCQSLNSPASNRSNDNFLVSQILSTDSQRQAANLCRAAAEAFTTTKKRWPSVIQTLLRTSAGDPIAPADFLRRMAATDYTPPRKTREVYLFIPAEMLRLFPSVHLFSNRDLLTGRRRQAPTYQIARATWGNRMRFHLTNGLDIDLKKRTALLNGVRPVPLNSYYVCGYGKDSKLRVGTVHFHDNGSLYLVRVPRQGLFLLLDRQTYNSTLVQLFLFEHYDRSLFESIDLNAAAKLYRVKR